MNDTITCGLTLSDITACAGMGQKQAARRLGVNYNWLNQILKRHNLRHLFPKPRQTFSQCITSADIIQVVSEGYTQKDAADILGVSERYFKTLVSRWQLNHLFPNSGKAAWISRNGYCN